MRSGLALTGWRAAEAFMLLLLVSPLLSAQPRSSVQLSWYAPADGSIAGYNVYRAGADGHYALLNVVPVQTVSYEDDSVAQIGAAYAYEVRSVDGGGVESPPSNVVLIAVPSLLNHGPALGGVFDTPLPPRQLIVPLMNAERKGGRGESPEPSSGWGAKPLPARCGRRRERCSHRRNHGGQS